MQILLVIFVGLIGTAVTEDYHDKWTEARIKQIFKQAGVDATAPTNELIAKNNYTVEIHNATTDDGYIVQMHRITGSPISPAAPGKPVMFLLHALFSSSADWVMLGPGKSLGYILADHGYDVWLGNARGNIYSKHHTKILSKKDYWNFSFHEIGYYDVPAMIDYALAATGQKKLGYVGHSQGAVAFWVMASQRPHYNDKIKVMFALGPAAYMGNLRSPVLRLITHATNTGLEIADLFGLYEFDLSPRFGRAVRAAFCSLDALPQVLCSNLVFLAFGYDKAQLNVSMLPIILGHFPAGASTRQLVHFDQEIKSHKFRQFDHGPDKNLLIYGSSSPPDYDLSLITAPVHLMYSENDLLVSPKDVEQLYNELGNPVELFRVPDKTWSHFAFAWGTDADTVIYAPILERLKKKYNF